MQGVLTLALLARASLIWTLQYLLLPQELVRSTWDAEDLFGNM